MSTSRGLTAAGDPGGGPLLFARYAYPPNELGYCGPDASRELLERADAATTGGTADDGGLRRQARGFEGAWPYLELIAHANGLADPLDRRVVEAYWVGNDLLRAVGVAALGDSLEERFRPRGRAVWQGVAGAVDGPGRAVPHHSFHVLAVYPWAGLLRSGVRDEALRVLDRCRIRWGQVLETSACHALIRTRPLRWDGRRLGEGPEVVERVLTRLDGYGLAPTLTPGDWCSAHWEWACDRLDRRGLVALRSWTRQQLAVVNGLDRPAPAQVLA
ncbi:DUF6390 family protein [Actinotalea sp. Marseille-Q4924]|uniref:DUF6390 family protein n=1 Tax=Actinotalea sp. Marseille-Q4924 TaxID=2866571 RepID=UPI001CE49637|nr:DUF6390 family protein [Actinotalea sp. Marseille-Q4924]